MVQAKPLSEITRHAIDLLSKEMGIVDTVRFLNQFTTGYGDYTKEREGLLKDLTLDEILDDKETAESTERLTLRLCDARFYAASFAAQKASLLYKPEICARAKGVGHQALLRRD